jgi:hypothetical protein
VAAKDRILEHVKCEGLDKAFTAKDLAAVASRGAIDVALSRLTKEGTIRRIGRGLYDCPRQSEILGEAIAPDIDQAAQAIARKHRWTITPDGAAAANRLGLSQQVPAKAVYLSDGPTRQISVGRRKISFRHASPKDLKMPNYSSRFVAQAIRFLGKENVGLEVMARLRRIIPAEDKDAFLEDTQYGTGWIHDVAKRLKED